LRATRLFFSDLPIQESRSAELPSTGRSRRALHWVPGRLEPASVDQDINSFASFPSQLEAK
jgi:hypothetical protein